MIEDSKAVSGMEFGVYTLADLVPNPHNGLTISAGQRIEEIIKAAKLADDLGLDVFGVGEHHRLDYAVSAPSVVLSAISQVTKRIRLASATTVLNTIDPVRLFQDFATLDLLSGGRAEIIAGRGAFVESFPLFGYDMSLYDQLFEEHLDLLLQLNANERVTWSGQFRSSLNNAEIAPRPNQARLPISIGVGGTPESAARAGRLGTGLTLVMLGGLPERFKPLSDIYWEEAELAGHSPNNTRIAVAGHAFIGADTQQAKDEFYPYHSNYLNYINLQRGQISRRMTREEFESVASPDTALFVGSSEHIIEKIMHQYKLFGHQRFLAQMDIGGLPYERVAENIERLAKEIAPVVRKATAKVRA